jgi:D-lactate dehydrogenase
MKVTFYSTQPYDREFFDRHNEAFGFELVYLEAKLSNHTALLSKGSEAICVFVNDHVDREVIQTIDGLGIRVIALRCAGLTTFISQLRQNPMSR